MRYLAFVVAGVIGHTAFALAGPLNPPAGPIAPTAKPLAEVEPRTAINATNTPGDAVAVFKITQPGSYYLAGNVVGAVGKRGIEVNSPGVTIDLNGFVLMGVPGSLEGIDAVGNQAVVVRNGIVQAWGGRGISLGSRARVEGVVVRNCGSPALYVDIDAIITGCNVSLNSGDGIVVGGCCAIISGCQVGNNVGTGIVGASSTTVIDCTVTDNDGNGIDVGANGAVRRCTVTFNAANGIVSGSRCTIADNICSSNSAVGIRITGSDVLLEGNNSVFNARGIQVAAAGNFITRNVCSGNTALNWDVVAGNKCLVVGAVSATPISGDAGGVSPGSTDPNANYTY